MLLLYDVDDGYSLLVMHAVAFICDGDKIVGCGRALSDGVCQAAIYNVALRPAYQGNGFGRAIVDSLVEQVKGCTIILYTHPQTLAMYEKFGFRRQKTGFVMFAGDEEQQKWLEELREEIDALNDIIFREVNNGVYKAGFARSQEAYEEAYHTVFNRLDWLEERLADRRYLFGDKITESDVRLYVTLARFDVAYHNIFRVNKKRLRDYNNLWAYARDLYQTPGFGDTTDFAAIKKHYHIDCNPGNIHQIIAKGPDEEAWLLPHGREKLSENKKKLVRYY